MDITAQINIHEVAATNRNEGTIDILDHTDHGGHNHVVLDSDNVKLRESQNLVPQKSHVHLTVITLKM